MIREFRDEITSIVGAALGNSASKGARSFGGSDTEGAGLLRSSDTVGARPSVSSAKKLAEDASLR